MVERRDDDYQREIEIGQRNAELTPLMKAWCRNVRVELVTSGVLAAAYQLPIGMIQVSCDHASNKATSMRLEWSARSFVVSHCATCAYHSESSETNLGRQILEDHRRQLIIEAQQRAEFETLKEHLVAEAQAVVSGDELSQATVSQLILEAIEGELDESRLKRLLGAVEIASDLFSSHATSLLAHTFRRDDGVAWMRLAGKLCGAMEVAPRPIWTAAMETLDDNESTVGSGSDDCCLILALEARNRQREDNLDLAWLAHVARIAFPVADYRTHRWRTDFLHVRPKYPGVVSLLELSLTLIGDEVRSLFAARLLKKGIVDKLCAAELICDLLPEALPILCPLIRPLLDSLDRPDDMYSRSDSAVCRAIAILYRHSPEAIEAEFALFRRRASSDAKALLYEVYSGVLSSEDGLADLANLHEVVVDRLYDGVADLHLDSEYRREASQRLLSVLQAYPKAGQRIFDRLCSRLTMTVRELASLEAPSQLPPMQMIALESRRLALRTVVRNLTAMVKAVSSDSPDRLFPAIEATLAKLSSRQDEKLKQQYVGMLAAFAKHRSLASRVIPELYKHVTDFTSVEVRRTAISQVGILLRQQPNLVPSDMVELLYRYLGDERVTIRVAAVDALRYRTGPSGDLAAEVLRNVLVLERHCFDNGSTDALSSIITFLRCNFRSSMQVLRLVVTELYPKYLQSQRTYFVERILEQMVDFLPEYSEISGPWIRAACASICSNLSQLSSSRNELLWSGFYTASSESLRCEFDKVEELFHELAPRFPHDAMLIVEVLSGKRLHDLSTRMLRVALATIPATKAHSYKRRLYEVGLQTELAQQTFADGDEASAAQYVEAALAALADPRVENE